MTICSVASSPDGRYLLSAARELNPILWDTKTGKEIHRFRGHTADAWLVAFLPDGRRALSAGHDGTIRLWEVDSGRELSVFSGHTSAVTAIGVSPDGRRLFSSQWGRQELWIWDVATSKLVQSLNWRSGMPTLGSFTSDGHHFVCGRDRAVRMYRLNDLGGSDSTAASAASGQASSKKKR
jgi:WD40 repeat protein